MLAAHHNILNAHRLSPATQHGVVVRQAQEAVSGVRPDKAQARGRALLNLKLRDAEGGLLGRTLLTFMLNKVQPVETVLGGYKHQCSTLF